MATQHHRGHPSVPAIDQKNGDYLLQAAQTAGITNPRELSNFMGQMQVESGGFRKTQEDLGYSGDRLESILTDRKTGKIRNGLTSEQVHAAAKGGEKTTAEALYGGDYGVGLGNRRGTDDSYTFRGRGFTQLTGRWNYEHMGKAVGLDLVNKPDLAADPANAAKIATQYWKERVVAKGAELDVTKATHAINGGHMALQERKDAAAHWGAELAEGHKPGQSTTFGSKAPVEPWKAALDSVAALNLGSTMDDVAAALPASMRPLSMYDPSHPGNALFTQAQAGMHAINAKFNFPNDQRTDNAAAAVAVAAQQAGMRRIDHMELGGTSGDRIIAAQGQLGTVQSKVIDVPTVQALNTSTAQSSLASLEIAQQQQPQQPQQQPGQVQQQSGPVMSR